jgi:TolB-like protein
MAETAKLHSPEKPDDTAADQHRLFVSYASQDGETANLVCASLETAGYVCWIAPRDVNPGSRYADAIVGAINDASVFVLVLSKNAVASAHVAREVERAASKHKRIIALRVQTVQLSRELEYFLSSSQWIDVSAMGMSAALAKLVAAVSQQSSPWVGSASPRSGSPTQSRKRIALAATSLIVFCAALAAGTHYWRSMHSTVQPTTTTLKPEKSVAVLPFADMSEKKDQEYFADGMAEAILDLLAKIPDMKVIGRTSSFQFKGKNEDLRTIGEKLNAAYVLEGSVRKSGDDVRVTVQLIDTRTGSHEWSET